MKKSIIALAVALGASSFAYADGTTLYGRVAMSYTYDDSGYKYTDKDGKTQYKGTSKFGNHGSRFGIKGSETLSGGTEVYYKYENRIKANLATNKLYIGFKGGFGDVSLGKQALPTDDLGDYSDPFNALGVGSINAIKTLSSSDNSVKYWSPDMGGFKIGAAIVADDNNNVAGTAKTKATRDAKHLDAYNIAAVYNANGIHAGLGYASTVGKEVATTVGANPTAFVGADHNVLSVSLGYGNDAFEIGVLAHRLDVEKSKSNPVYARLGGLYNISEMDAIYAGAGMYDYDVKNMKNSYEYSLGYQHKFSKRSKMWAEYGFTDWNNNKHDANKLNIGVRTDF